MFATLTPISLLDMSVLNTLASPLRTQSFAAIRILSVCTITARVFAQTREAFWEIYKRDSMGYVLWPLEVKVVGLCLE
jgi:hypothetical protein